MPTWVRTMLKKCRAPSASSHPDRLTPQGWEERPRTLYDVPPILGAATCAMHELAYTMHSRCLEAAHQGGIHGTGSVGSHRHRADLDTSASGDPGDPRRHLCADRI